MASVQKGSAVFWSIATTASATGLGAGLIQSITFTPSATKTEVKGADGATKTEVYSNAMESITLEIIPNSATSIALGGAACTLPEMGADLTVVDSVDTEIAGASTTVYIVDTASKSRSVDGVAKLNLTAHRFTAGQLATIS
jgi:hypothetical protein